MIVYQARNIFVEALQTPFILFQTTALINQFSKDILQIKSIINISCYFLRSKYNVLLNALVNIFTCVKNTNGNIDVLQVDSKLM